jgi:hypothetical protein
MGGPHNCGFTLRNFYVRLSPMMNKTASPAHEQVGHRFAPWKTSVTAARQHGYHEPAGIDSKRFGDWVDVSLLGNDCLKGARSPDDLGNPRLHYGVRVRQTVPLALGTGLVVQAVVTAVEPVRRGRLIRITFAFLAEFGQIPVEIEHQSLILDPDPVDTDPAPAVDRDWSEAEAIRDVPMSLASVSGYSHEFPYLEGHHSQAAAEAIGMRAPIAQGLHGFTLLMSEIAADRGAPSTCDIQAEFRRPIFCDETVRLVGQRGADGQWDDLAVLKGDGKPTTQVKVFSATW